MVHLLIDTEIDTIPNKGIFVVLRDCPMRDKWLDALSAWDVGTIGWHTPSSSPQRTPGLEVELDAWLLGRDKGGGRGVDGVSGGVGEVSMGGWKIERVVLGQGETPRWKCERERERERKRKREREREREKEKEKKREREREMVEEQSKLPQPSAIQSALQLQFGKYDSRLRTWEWFRVWK